MDGLLGAADRRWDEPGVQGSVLVEVGRMAVWIAFLWVVVMLVVLWIVLLRFLRE